MSDMHLRMPCIFEGDFIYPDKSPWDQINKINWFIFQKNTNDQV